MRRIFALIVTLALILSLPAHAVEGYLVYSSDFSFGTDDWYARSSGSAQISTLPENALRITGRTDSWHSPGRDFPLISGGRYEISVKVRQTDVGSAAFMLSVAHTEDGVETYENLARDTAQSGEWLELKCVYTAGGYDKFVLYVETVGASDISFDICDFRVYAPEGEPEPTPEPQPMTIEEVENMPSLKAAYSNAFDFGSCVPRSLVANEKAQELIREQFSILTHENELKPESVIDIPACRALAETDQAAVAVHFDAAKPLLDFAMENGIKVHAHVLVWHSQTPETFFLENYQVGRPYVSREIMLARLENYISAVMAYLDENYPGVVVSWDVVNEAIDDGTGKLRKSPWLDVIGEDYLARAFELARKYAPEGTLLYYNDYNTPNSLKLGGITKLLEELVAEGNIDGYGFQMHYGVGSPSIAQIEAAVHRISKMGLKLRVSELDITVDDNSEESFTRQAEKFSEIMELLISYGDYFEAVQVWGINDSVSWRASQYPLLLDGNYNPKPAFWAVLDAAKAD